MSNLTREQQNQQQQGNFEMTALHGDNDMADDDDDDDGVDDDDDLTADDEFVPQEHFQQQHRSKRQVWISRWLLVGSAAIYGSSFPMITVLNESIPVSINMPLRFGLASVLTVPWLLFPCNGEAWMATLLGLEVGFWNGLGYVSQAVGLEDGTKASKSSFIFSLCVVVVPLLDYVVGKHIACRQWTGAILAVGGCACLELVGGEGFNAADDLTSYLQPLVFGIAYWRMERAVHLYPHQAPRLTAALLLAIFLCSITFLWWSVSQPTWEIMEWHEWFQNWKIVLSIIYSGCVTTAATNYMETVALRTLTATETTLILSVEPLFGTLFATIILGERMGKEFVYGAILITGGCIYSTLGLKGLKHLFCCDTFNSGNGDDQSKPNTPPRSRSLTSPSGLFVSIQSPQEEDRPFNGLV